jgi:hypothetical protein
MPKALQWISGRVRPCHYVANVVNFNIKFKLASGALTMETVSILEFRRHADAVIRKVRGCY